MNTFVADPHWGWWIIWYFYLGGIASGAYFLATMADLFGTETDRLRTRVGYLLTPPLLAICGILLIADLGQPTRFWHMLLDRDTWQPHMKWLSPMSIGAWAVLVFGLVSAISFAGALVESGRVGLVRFAPWAQRLHRGIFGRVFDLLGTTCGFFVASYTGVLLTASNQPVWSDSSWIGALFLASAASSGLAAIRLLHPWFEVRTADRPNSSDPWAKNWLDTIEPWIWGLELFAAACFLSSFDLTSLRRFADLGLAWPFVGGALGLGVVVPAVLHWRPVLPRRSTATVAAVSVLLGGFLLRYSVLTLPPALLRSARPTSAEARHPAADSIREGTSP